MYNLENPLNDFPRCVIDPLSPLKRELLALAVTRVYIQGQTDAIREERIALQSRITEEMNLESPVPYQGR
jgi:hypothetical protein